MGWAEIFNNHNKPTKPFPKMDLEKRILVIDDEVTITDMLEAYLEKSGYRVFLANDATEGLKKYHAEKPHVIITDIIMPGKSGLDLLEEIRLRDSETEIIVFTGFGDMKSAIKALKLQASDFILKPIDLEIISLTIIRAIDRYELKLKLKNYTLKFEDLFHKVNTSKNYFEAVIENSPNALITYDKKGVITSWNAESEHVTGYKAKEVLGKTLEQILRLDNVLLDMESEDKPEGGVSSSVAQILTRDRQLRFINRNASKIMDEDDNVIGGVESFIDLTEQIKGERLLEKRYLQVQTINDISKMVASENDFQKLPDYVLSALHKTFFESSLLSLFYIEKKQKTFTLKSFAGHGVDKLKSVLKTGKKFPLDYGVPGKVHKSGKKIIVDNVSAEPGLSGKTLSDANSAFAFPIHSKKHFYGVLSIENSERIHLDESDQQMLEAIAEFLGISAERIQLLEKITQQNNLLEQQAKDLRKALRKEESHKGIIEKQNKRLLQDLQKAGEFQKSLLPEKFPKLDNVHFQAIYLPSTQLGGDIYDVFEIDDSLVGIILADASGHGVAAAMLSAMFKMTLQKYAAEILDPSQVLAKLNSDFCKVLQMGEFFTAFYAILNRKTGRLTYANAGHPRPILYNYKKDNMEELDTEGFLLGVMEEGITYEQKGILLKDKVRLLIYTDGVNEAIDKNGIQFGEERIQSGLLDRAKESQKKYLSGLQSDLKKYTGTNSFEDDISVLLIDFTPKTGS